MHCGFTMQEGGTGMVCDVSTVVNTEGAQISLEESIEVQNLAPDIKDAKLNLSGKITCTGGVLVLDAKIDAKINTICARCLSELTLPIAFSFSETLVQNGHSDDTDKDSVIVFDGTEIDVGEIAVNNLLLNISSKYLCKEECLGLCSKCGKNLNEGKCDCDFVEIDPRWEKLKNFK